MQSSIVAAPVPPYPPNVSRLRLRIAAACSVLGVAAIVGAAFWPASAIFTFVPAVLLLATSIILLAPFLVSCQRSERHDIRKLYRDRQV